MAETVKVQEMGYWLRSGKDKGRGHAGSNACQYGQAEKYTGRPAGPQGPETENKGSTAGKQYIGKEHYPFNPHDILSHTFSHDSCQHDMPCLLDQPVYRLLQQSQNRTWIESNSERGKGKGQENDKFTAV
jgi:hypothetical protein